MPVYNRAIGGSTMSSADRDSQLVNNRLPSWLLCCGRLAAVLLFALVGAEAAPVTLTIQTDATFNSSTAAFSGSGTATLSGYGSGTLNFANTPPSTTIVTFTLDFGSGNVLHGTMTPTAGSLPAPGGTSSGTLSMAITGGTGIFAGATGSFPTISGTATSTCSPCSGSINTLTFTLSGAGALTLPAPPPPTPAPPTVLLLLTGLCLASLYYLVTVKRTAQ